MEITNTNKRINAVRFTDDWTHFHVIEGRAEDPLPAAVKVERWDNKTLSPIGEAPRGRELTMLLLGQVEKYDDEGFTNVVTSLRQFQLLDESVLKELAQK